MGPTRPNWRVRPRATAFLHRQAWRCACPKWTCCSALPDRIAQRRRLPGRVAAGAGDCVGGRRPGADRRAGAPLHVAQRLLQTLEPVGVGARNLAEECTLQLSALAADARTAACRRRGADALQICQQPLASAGPPRCGAACAKPAPKAVLRARERTRAAMALIARLEPRPGGVCGCGAQHHHPRRHRAQPGAATAPAGSFHRSLNPDVRAAPARA